MRIISPRKIREFWEQHPASKNVMRDWLKKVKAADWDSFSDVRQTFNHADIYKCCTIFDVGGNNYRIITKIQYEYKKVFIRFVLTHFEYGKYKWHSDCQD